MEFNNKKLERTSKIVYFLISFILGVFLIALSTKIIGDIDDWKVRPHSSDFENNILLDSLKQEKNNLSIETTNINNSKQHLFDSLSLLDVEINNFEESFNNWIETRKTLGKNDDDPEVKKRVKELDQLRAKKLTLEKLINQKNDRVSGINNIISEISKTESKEYNRANEELDIAYRDYELSVFLSRLLFAFPILFLGIYLAIKKRKHKYWPLFRGFIIFSAYVFFVGLVPYLPSYGGYIRYIVGIIISIALGIYSINNIRKFIDKKKEELKTSTTERAKNVELETAEKSLNQHMCPSCGKDFIVPSFEKSSTKDVLKRISHYCRFCGLELFKKCKTCNHTNFAHLPFCSNCGDKVIEN